VNLYLEKINYPLINLDEITTKVFTGTKRGPKKNASTDAGGKAQSKKEKRIGSEFAEREL